MKTKTAMIELTYIFHSGFILQSDNNILIFDYWLDPSDVISRYIKKECYINKQCRKHIYVFASHFHEDHFTKKIFEWRNITSDITFILSKDILKRRRAAKEDADVWMVNGSEWEDGNIRVKATGSNDSGVSWIVEMEGKRIFHAGDLCNWYARFLADGANKACGTRIYSKEFATFIDPVAEEKQFLGELKNIRKITDSFDIVMFPVDGRIGNGYTLGARQFIERFKVGLFIPMHFAMSGFESAWRMEPFCKEKNIPFWCIRNEGDRICMTDNIIIRRSSEEDIPQLHNIFAVARKFMAETENPNQWNEDYPSDELLRKDIESGDSYVILYNNRTVATFVLRYGIDPTYNIIYEGKWLNDNPYATIHRIASNGEIKGILHLAMLFALQKYNNIRIDTHRDNKVMRNAIAAEGFKYCGIIHCWSGDERLAYQYFSNQDCKIS